MIMDGLLALGLLLATASQLRVGGSPIGPGEICLVLWLILMLGREARRLGPPLTPALSRLLIFWAVFTVSQGLGTLMALASGEAFDPQWFLHDLMAYPLLAAVSCLSVVEPGAVRRLRRVAWLLTTIGAASLALQLANGWELIAIPMIEPWFWERFRGWSANPNQLALLCVVLGLLSLHLAEAAARLTGRIAAIACLILSVYVGRLTKSDTFTLALAASGPIFLGLKLRAWLLSSEPKIPLRSAFALIAVIAVPLLLASSIPFAVSTASEAERLAVGLGKNNGREAAQEASLRFSLWREAISRGLESRMLGLGPGPHLEIPASIVAGRESTPGQPDNLEHPTQNSAANFEAHNTVLDLFTQGGLLAVASFVWLVATALFLTYKARLAGLVTLLCGIGIFGLSSLIIRHPIFWFAITLCLVAEGGTGKPSTVRSRG